MEFTHDAHAAYNRLNETQNLGLPAWGRQDEDDYKLVKIDNCVLVFGALPLSDIGRMTKGAPKKALLDPYVAQLADANLSAGLREDLQALAEKLKPEALRRTRQQMDGLGLSHEAISWLACGQRGTSSEAMFLRMTAVTPPRSSPNNKAYPRDGADLARCRKLLEAVPEISQRIGVMADVSPEWAGLVEHWDELTATMDAEAPDWRNGSGNASKTSDRMNEVLAAAKRPSTPKP